MSELAARILEEALRLPETERAAVAEGLLTSLDRPDPHVDRLWAREVEDRLAAYDAGRMQAFPADEVLAESDDA